MMKEILNFRIELVDRKNNEEASDKFARSFVHSLGLKTYSGTWSSIELDSPTIYKFISDSKKFVFKKFARFAGMCSLHQYLIEDTETEWYQLETNNSIEIVGGEIITTRVDKMPPNIHTAYGWGYNIYVSEKFKEVVEENNLIGLDFVWLKDVGRFKAPQWFLPVILKPLGRGLDHHWFDRRTLRGWQSKQPLNPKYRCGISRFKASQIKTHIQMDELHKDIISLFDPEVLTFDSFRTFLRTFTPNNDFAFIWDTEDIDRALDGLFIQNRDLCINKKTKSILIQNQLITENQLKPIQILEKAPEDVEVLDGIDELPGPFYSNTHVSLEELKEKIALEWSRFSKLNKPVRKITFNQVIKLLLEARKSRPDRFQSPLSEDELANYDNIPLPPLWIEVLKKTNGCDISPDCGLVPLRKLEQFGIEKQLWCEGVEEEFPTNLIPVAYSGDGEWFSLVIESSPMQDAKVRRISHETCHPINEWNSIADFLYDMLSDY